MDAHSDAGETGSAASIYPRGLGLSCQEALAGGHRMGMGQGRWAPLAAEPTPAAPEPVASTRAPTAIMDALSPLPAPPEQAQPDLRPRNFGEKRKSHFPDASYRSLKSHPFFSKGHIENVTHL